jgi:aerobic C4-dicarboxylate transport protein
VATIVVAKWTNELDENRLQAALNNETWVEAQEPEALDAARSSKMAG